MAILKSVVDVNNGNTGWTNTDVMDALETVFANLGFHGGSASSGVPQALISPGNVISYSHESWRAAGGGEYWTTAKTWTYDVTAQGTTAYRWLRKIFFATWSYAYSENDGNYPNQIRIDGHGYCLLYTSPSPRD